MRYGINRIINTNLIMETSFEHYFTDLAISSVMKERIEYICHEITDLYNVKIEDLFLCDIVKNDAGREFTSLWLFVDNYVIECKEFINNDDYDLINLNKTGVTYFNIRKSNFTKFCEPSDNSNVIILIRMSNHLNCNFMATGKNCKHLIEISKKYFIAKLKD